MTKKPITGARGAQHHASRPGLSARTARDPRRSSRRASPWGTGCAIAARESGARAAHLLSKRRRLGPGKALPRHGGGVESVLASPAESVETCTAKRHATGIREDRDGGVRGSVGIVHGFGPTRPQSAKSIRRSDSTSVVKRSNLRSRWAASHRAHAQPLQHEAIVREAEDWGRWAGKRQGTGAR